MTGLFMKYGVEIFFSIFTGILMFGYDYTLKKLKIVLLEIQASNEGTRMLLKDRIKMAYNYYAKNGFCTIEEFEDVSEMFEEYKKLGGNGTIPNVMEKLKKLIK